MFLFPPQIKKKIIFDLDRTLWRATVESHPHLKNPKPFPGTNDTLTLLQEHYSLNIASRSSKPNRCHHFLNLCFPQIHFDQIEIFPAPHKRTHIQNILGFQYHHPFFFIDDEKHILDDISKTWTNSNIIWRHPNVHISHLCETLLSIPETNPEQLDLNINPEKTPLG